VASPRLSIITPVNIWNNYRKESLKRAIDSVEAQTFRDYEHIVVNDGSTQDFEIPPYSRLNVVNVSHNERVVALNEGFKHAQGQIFCLLDSDDEYEKHYLERVDYFFRKWPKYKMFNFGARYVHADGGTVLRGTFKPKKLKVGHEVFGGGNIVNGTFVWHRSVYDDLGAYPSTHIKDIDCTEINYGGVRDLYIGSPYDFSAWFQLEFPEQRQFFMVDHEAEPNKIIKELGNPWGNDHALFYKYTRKYHSKPIDDEFLYVVHPKQGVE